MRHEHQSTFDADVVLAILSYCDRDTNANCARVSHLWAEMSLDNIWRGMNSLLPLLRILCPLSEKETSKRFSRELEAQDWDRFEYYARRVQTLRISTSDKLHKSVFIELGCFRKPQCFFPNLLYLDLALWDCTKFSILPDVGLILPRFSTMFLCKGLQKLRLRLPSRDPSYKTHAPESISKKLIPLSRLFSYITCRSPNLSKIFIDWFHKDDLQESDLISFITGLTRLQIIYLPPCTVTPCVLQTLSRLENIRQIESTETGTVSGTITEIDDEDGIYGDYALDSDRFETLNSLQISGVLANITPVFYSLPAGAPFPELTVLHISLLRSYFARDIRDLNIALSTGCPNLEILKLKHDIGEEQDTFYQEQPITIHDMDPLINLKRLSTLIVESNVELSVADDALTAFLLRLPSITTLHLIQEPFRLHRPALTLGVLENLALHNSPIKDLALYIDAIPMHHLWDSECLGRLQNLAVLHLGDSLIDDSEAVASYLQQFLPFTFNPDARIRGNLPEGEERGKRRTKWLEVERLLKFSSRVRRMDAERIRVLEKRLEAFVMKN